MKTMLRVDELRAVAESAHVEKTLEAVPGVECVEVDSLEKTLIVTHENVAPEELFSALAAAGYSRARLEHFE